MAFIDKITARFPRVNDYIDKAKIISLPGFDEVPIYDVFIFFIGEIKRDIISVRARSIAFTFLLALFPGIIFLFTLLPYIPIDSFQDSLISFIRNLLPAGAFGMLEENIVSVIKDQRGGLLSFGLLVSLFISTNGVMAIMESFDKTHDTFIKRNMLRKRWVALKLTMVLFFLLILAIVFVVAGSFIIEQLLSTFDILTPLNYVLLNTLKWVIIILLYFNCISFIYYYGPAVKKKFRFVSPGSTLATVLAILFSIGFSYFVNNFGNYNKVYGSIGTIIALQVYIYLNSFALLIGFELNSSIAYNKNLRQVYEEEIGLKKD